MPKISEDRFLLAFGIVFAVWVFVALPLISSWQAFQFARILEYSNPKDQSDKAGNQGSNNVSQTEDANDRIARYTMWLAILTGGLVVMGGVQGFFLIRADKTARISAEAARVKTQLRLTA